MARARAATDQLGLFGAPPPRDAPIGAVEAWLLETGRLPAVGLDEAGRGPLAGPVVAAAVVLPDGKLPAALVDLDDSKALSAVARERLARAIREAALATAVVAVPPAEIDRINILEATRQAMRRALAIAARRLGRPTALLLVDGHLPLPAYLGDQLPLVKGDGRSWHIAAASIIAKVVRDRLMVIAERDHPGYGFAVHKGYGTRAHRAALARLGPCPLHRRSFRWSPPND
ncbi:MAG: ribonuclease HII [Myxococcales bacterium]|nr:ribonuclease HII [Myxococcales bacterium]